MDPEEIEKALDLKLAVSFGSKDEEIEYWKRRALVLKKGYEELKQDFDEYQEDSKTLEQELDTQLKQEEQKNKELTSNVSRLQNDNENLRSKIEQMSAEHNARMSECIAEITTFRKTGEEINHYVRQLEQKNDDLERANRAAAMSIEDFETKLNQAIERNVYLESELDEKDNLKSMVQRLKDETRDLRYELQVTKKGQTSTSSAGGGSGSGGGGELFDSNRMECVTPPQPFNVTNKAHQAALGTPTSTARMSPLSIVNDLLRKVGALENKLTSYPRKEEGGIPPRRGSNKMNGENKNIQNKKSPNHRNSSSSREVEVEIIQT